MKCHFVYSVPTDKTSLLTRIRRKIRSLLNRIGVRCALLENRRPRHNDFQKWPVCSPYENTKHVYSALCKKNDTLLYHLTERVDCRIQEDDLFIGHPYFPYEEGGYGITEMVCNGKNRPKKLAVIAPLHCDTTVKTSHINKDFLEHVDGLIPKVDLLFGIMGKYWWDQWDSSPYAHWKSKMVRLDMAIDTTMYPRLKKRFNTRGERGFLFIGGSWDPRKGSDYFSQLMSLLGDYPCGWLGNGPDIENVPCISKSRPLTPEFMTELFEQFDFLVSPAIADPNPTTILESMSWGLPVVCTPQSGYYETGYRKNIYLGDTERSINVLHELQQADEDELIVMADKAREVVENEYTWDKFCSEIIKYMYSS